MDASATTDETRWRTETEAEWRARTGRTERTSAPRSRFGWAAVRFTWLLAAIVVAAGTAGIVAGVGGPPGSPSRGELTAAGDRAIQPGFDRALADLRQLSGQVDELGTLGRAALAALTARDDDTLNRVIAQGSDSVDAISSAATSIRGRLRDLPGVAGAAPPLPPAAALTLGAESQARYAALDRAATTTAGLDEAWVRFTAGAVAAVQLATLLDQHDLSTAAAARLGRGAHYANALTQLATSKKLIDQASALRDTLANTVDVTTLARWLDLNSAYDDSLRTLYDALRRSNGRANAEVRKALEAEAAAHDELPPDTRALAVIMGEVARGGLNQAVIEIETAKGDLDAAIDALTGPVGASPSASPAP